MSVESQAIDCIDRMLRTGEPFEMIEQCIEHLEISDDAKSSLWLLAWSETGSRERREVVRSLLWAPRPAFY